MLLSTDKTESILILTPHILAASSKDTNSPLSSLFFVILKQLSAKHIVSGFVGIDTL